MWGLLSEAAYRVVNSTILYTSLGYNVGAWALTSRNWYVTEEIIISRYLIYDLK